MWSLVKLVVDVLAKLLISRSGTKPNARTSVVGGYVAAACYVVLSLVLGALSLEWLLDGEDSSLGLLLSAVSFCFAVWLWFIFRGIEKKLDQGEGEE